MGEIPILDMSAPGFGKSFTEALEEHGFVSVVGHGLDPEVLQDAYDVAVRTFALPDEVKRRYETPENGRKTGYTSFGVEHAKEDPQPDLKEFWYVYNPVHRIQTPFPAEVPKSSRV